MPSKYEEIILPSDLPRCPICDDVIQSEDPAIIVVVHEVQCLIHNFCAEEVFKACEEFDDTVRYTPPPAELISLADFRKKT